MEVVACSLKIFPDNRRKVILKKIIKVVSGSRILENYEVLFAIGLPGLGIDPAHGIINN